MRYAALSSTACQRIFEIIIFRSHKVATLGASMGPKALAQAFNEHARLSSKSEDVSGDYIAAALHVHDKALRLQPVTRAAHATFENTPTTSQSPSLAQSQPAYGNGLKPAEPRRTRLRRLPIPPAQAIDALESRFGVDSPFDSVYKLNALVRRARAPAQIAWCCCSLADKVPAALTPAPTSACGPSSAMPARGTKDKWTSSFSA